VKERIVDTIERLRGFVIAELGWTGPRDALTPDVDLLEEGVLDSLGIFRMVEFLEDDLGVEVDDDELVPTNFATLAAIEALVEAKQAAHT
jgi:acyl carrier protein